ncbi:MAG: LCP family protein [Actinomycetota bacterium]|nr:LCP family protein [Actinomycetota bacterium]
MLALNIVVVLACLVGAFALIYGKDQLDGRLQTEKVELQTTVATMPPQATTSDGGGDSTAVPAETFPPADPTAQNFLITGSDANACVDLNSAWAGAADPARTNLGSRSDTIMVMRVDPVTRAAAVLSFPRDLWIKIPGKGKNRINSAYVQNDYTLLAQTLLENFNISVDHYIQVDFCAFKRIVDAVGGVSVPFDTPIVDRHVGLSVSPAAGEALPFCHSFIGDEALAYVRSRHLRWVDAKGETFEDRAADFGRISRQQDFLRRVLQTALSKGLYDPKVARGILESLQNDIVTESGFTIDDMLRFAGVMRDVAPETIRTYQVDSVSASQGGTSVRVPSLDSDNMKAILAIFQGTAPLAGAPEQVFDTTTSDGGSTVVTTATTAAPTTVDPTENGLGDIIPPKDVQC